jgi:hypothetical protein
MLFGSHGVDPRPGVVLVKQLPPCRGFADGGLVFFHDIVCGQAAAVY